MEKTIGIIGGLGPYAGLDISKKIFDNTLVKSDRDHIDQILISFSSKVPDRSKFLMSHSVENPAYEAIKQVDQLICLGADMIAIACNQMHSKQIWTIIESHLLKSADVKLVSIVDEVLDTLKTKHKNEKIGIIARSGVIKHNIYSSALVANDFNIFTHSDDWQDRIDDCIANDTYGIKIQPNPVSEEASHTLNEFINYMMTNGVSTVIMACTEIPLAIDSANYPKLKFIDASEILARSLVKYAAPQKLKQC